MGLEYIESGATNLVHDGFLFTKDGENKDEGTIYWKCCEYKRKYCRGRVTTRDDQVATATGHNHPPYRVKIYFKKAMPSVKRKGNRKQTAWILRIYIRIRNIQGDASTFFTAVYSPWSSAWFDVALGLRFITHEEARTYNRMIQGIKEKIPHWQPKTITTDFEVSALKAFGECFPGSVQRGCHFYFGQCLWRKVQSFNSITEYLDWKIERLWQRYRRQRSANVSPLNCGTVMKLHFKEKLGRLTL
ncbi:unnamed protein product [Allacma fusca]|uniref:FLYWCH-type domain-containing protein n=1 Tax=Allacma fusca TaxID=39272 RepID=A0A8J2JF51_9HEXA|nr:unnamed protein product [Allacma fusca]